MRLIVVLLLLLPYCIFSAPDVLAQSGATQSPPPIKSKHVWSNEDVQSIPGSISVVGETSSRKDSDSVPPVRREGGRAKAPEDCVSDSWAAAVTVMLRAQGVTYSRQYWAEKLFGGSCVSEVRVDAVAKQIDGDYALDSGKKLTLSSQPVRGLIPAPEVVAALQNSRPFVIAWKGRAWLVTNVDFVDHEYSSGSGITHLYNISKLMLEDVASGRSALFDAITNKPSEIEASLSVKVTERQ